jgi:hypothetical protein
MRQVSALRRAQSRRRAPVQEGVRDQFPHRSLPVGWHGRNRSALLYGVLSTRRNGRNVFATQKTAKCGFLGPVLYIRRRRAGRLAPAGRRDQGAGRATSRTCCNLHVRDRRRRHHPSMGGPAAARQPVRPLSDRRHSPRRCPLASFFQSDSERRTPPPSTAASRTRLRSAWAGSWEAS